MLGLGACSPKFYTANTQNVPLISEQGEIDINLSGNGNQLEFLGAYGFTDKLSLMINAGFFNPSDLENGNGGSGRFFEAGGGYFKPFADKFVFETYALLGFGNFENHLPSTVLDNPTTLGEISSSILRVGIQPNIGYKTEYFQTAISSRISSLNYFGIDGDLIFAGTDEVAYLKDNRSNFLIEPAITIKGGVEKFKIQLQLGYSANLSNSDFKQNKAYSTLGLNVNF